MIILTGFGRRGPLAADAMTQGAQTYMIKGQIESRALHRALALPLAPRMQAETDLIGHTRCRFKD